MDKFGLGCLPSPPDRRDYHIASFFPVETVLPEEYMPKVLIPAMNQGGVGACVAYGLELATAYHEYKERSKLERFSQNYIYANREPDHHQGEGMYPREALKMLSRYGVCRSDKYPKTYPLPYSMLKGTLTPEMNADAVYQRILSYAALYTDDEIKTALVKNGPVGITISVYDSFENCPSNGMLPMPDPSKETLRGYHFITIVGWRKDRHWVIQNSWLPWGDIKMSQYSMAYMPFGYPMLEKWALVDEELPPPKRTKIIMWIGNPIAHVDGKPVQLDVAPEVKNGRTLVPLRFVAENMGANVKWYAQEKRIEID